MTLPSSGLITMSQVKTELGIAQGTTLTLGSVAVRNLFGKPSGTITLGNGRGKSARTYAKFTDTAGGGVISADGLTLSALYYQGSYLQMGYSVSYKTNISKTSGKHYFEYYPQAGDANANYYNRYWSLGIATDSFLTGNGYGVGFDPGGQSLGWYEQYGMYLAGYIDGVAIGIHDTGNVVGIAVDLDAKQIHYYYNGALLRTYPCDTSNYTAAISTPYSFSTIKANFGATPFVYTPPAGYNAGLYL